ncbi:MAG TPA: MFS transporter [Acidimicrobiia bacterium]
MPGSFLTARWFLVVFAASLATEVTHSLMIHLPGFMLDVGMNEAGIGVVSGVATAVALIARPWIGRTMDIRSRRLVIRLGVALLAVACIGYSFVTTSGPLLWSMRGLQALGDAMSYTAFFTYVADRVPAGRRTQGLAIFGISGLAPIGLGTVLGDFVLARADYHAMFLVGAGFCALALGLAFTLESTGAHAGAAPRGFMAVLRSRRMRPLWFGTALLAVAFSVVFIYVKTYVEQSGLESVGPFFLSYAATAVALRLFFGWVPDRVGPRKLLGPALAVYALSFLVMATGPEGAALLPLAGLLGGTGHAIVFPVLLAMVTTRSGAADRGGAAAAFTAVLDLGGILFAPLLGLLIIQLGYPVMFVTSAMVILVGAAVFYRLDRAEVAEMLDTAELEIHPYPAPPA